MEQFKKYFAEFLGTATLVGVGCGTAVALGCVGTTVNAAYIGTALAFGLVLMAMAYAIGNISGCHVNPAVSLAMLIDGRMDLNDFIGYVVAQLVGAAVGCIPIGLMNGFDCGFGANALYNGNVGLSLLIECLLTFIFVLTILGVTAKKETAGTAGIVIGLTLFLVHMVGIHYTGTSVNPARSFGVALFAGGSSIASLWVLIVAPLVGGALVAYCYRALNGKRTE